MTDGDENTAYNDFAKWYAESKELGKIATMATKFGLEDSAEKVGEIVDARAKDWGFAEDVVSRLPQLPLKDKYQYLTDRAEEVEHQAYNFLRKNPDRVLGGIPKDKLERLALSEDFRKTAGDTEREVMAIYGKKLENEDFMKRYESGNLTEKEQKEVLQRAQIGAAKKGAEDEKKKQNRLGYDNPLTIGTWAKIYATSIQYADEKTIREYVKAGFEEEQKQLREVYDKLVAEKGMDAAKAVGNTLKKLVASDNPNEFNAGVNSVYQAGQKDE